MALAAVTVYLQESPADESIMKSRMMHASECSQGLHAAKKYVSEWYDWPDHQPTVVLALT